MCKIVKGMCVALFDQMVEKATIVLCPVVESIKAFTVCYIHSPSKLLPKLNIWLLQFTNATRLLLPALENLRIYPVVV